MVNCFILGEDVLKQTFVVDINPDKKVSHLRELIFDANFNRFEYESIDSIDLVLYEVAISINDEDEKYTVLKNKLDTKIDIKIDLEGVLLKPLSSIVNHFTTQNGNQIHVIVTCPTFAKRIKLEDSQNNTAKFLDDLLRPFDESINCDNVEQHLSAELLCKLPSLYADQLPNVLESDMSTIVNTRDLCSVVDIIMNLIFKAKPGGEAFTSDCINKHILDIITLAQRFVLGCSNIEIERNRAIHSDSNTSGKKKQLDRPDVTIYYNQVLVMMGEEKALESDIRIAENDLDNYLSYWNPLAFGRLPLVMAFVAAGERLRFFYYYYDKSSNKPNRVDIGDVLLIGGSNRKFNFMALQRTINFIRILQTWNRDKLLNIPKLKLFEIKTRANGGTVTIFPKKIQKRAKINSSEEREFYERFYDNIFPILGGQYKKIKCSFTKTSMYLELAPVGYTTTPKTEKELRAAISDVLKTVIILHENNIVHRDIRWENIIRLMNKSWMLIDFEEAASIGDIRPTLNIAAPEYKIEDSCKGSGDIWMIGNLIDNQRIYFDISETAKNFRDRLMFKNPDERPTAADAIEDDWFNDI